MNTEQLIKFFEEKYGKDCKAVKDIRMLERLKQIKKERNNQEK